MYLWKCWRDTRVKFLVSFGVLLAFFGLYVLLYAAAVHGHRPSKYWQMQEILQIGISSTSSLVLFVGWILSKENVGADIRNGFGDFLLTRPSSRGRFVWTGWAVGMTEGVVLWIVLSAILCGAIFLKLQLLGIHVLNAPQTSVSPGLVFLLFAIFLLNLGLIYGLAYCIGTVARSGSWALIASAIVVIGYGFLESTLRHQWNIHLPDFFLAYYSHNKIEIPSTLAFTVHGCLLVAFPAVAHFVLERMET